MSGQNLVKSGHFSLRKLNLTNPEFPFRNLTEDVKLSHFIMCLVGGEQKSVFSDGS